MVIRAPRCDKLTIQFCAMTVSTQTVCQLSDYLALHGPNKAVRQKQKATVQGCVYLLLDFSRPYHLGIRKCTLVYTVALLNMLDLLYRGTYLHVLHTCMDISPNILLLRYFYQEVLLHSQREKVCVNRHNGAMVCTQFYSCSSC